MNMKRVTLALSILLAVYGLPIKAMAQTPPPSGVDPKLFGGLKYRMVGPFRGGRVTAVTGHRKQPDQMRDDHSQAISECGTHHHQHPFARFYNTVATLSQIDADCRRSYSY